MKLIISEAEIKINDSVSLLVIKAALFQLPMTLKVTETASRDKKLILIYNSGSCKRRTRLGHGHLQNTFHKNIPAKCLWLCIIFLEHVYSSAPVYGLQ